MAALPEFRTLYTLVRFSTHGPGDEQAIVWVRREDSRVGIDRRPDRVTVPGFLLASPRAAAYAEFDDSGRLGAVVAAGQGLSLPSLVLEPGTWRGAVDAAGVATLIVLAAPNPPSITEDGEVTFAVSRAFPEVAIVVRADPSNAVHVRSVTFVRER
jgi:hypothetical protein